MWISKKEYGRLVDENLELKRKNETYVYIENELFIRATEAEEKLFKLGQEIEGYKKFYADELQKRLELAEKVREMEDKP